MEIRTLLISNLLFQLDRLPHGGSILMFRHSIGMACSDRKYLVDEIRLPTAWQETGALRCGLNPQENQQIKTKRLAADEEKSALDEEKRKSPKTNAYIRLPHTRTNSRETVRSFVPSHKQSHLNKPDPEMTPKGQEETVAGSHSRPQVDDSRRRPTAGEDSRYRFIHLQIPSTYAPARDKTDEPNRIPKIISCLAVDNDPGFECFVFRSLSLFKLSNICSRDIAPLHSTALLTQNNSTDYLRFAGSFAQICI
ncbi:hypothetical protein HNY73_003469 [Argiope bruennichi]|uniref:Uncharacterized protein n=1 Tax=Argiope bruennichi TaxID=94029 RepID=A0A8T0FLI8_ARGBR|nr:hypothetical protein HNY73_003469 [Argiope bruennichi]